LLVLFNKPYSVVCQFSPHAPRSTLKDFVVIPNVYPAERLDWDSEGLVILTADGKLQHRIADPSNKLEKIYGVQLEGEADDVAIRRLMTGIEIDGHRSRPARASRICEPANLGTRDPPIRYRRHIPTSWLEIRLTEGRNRQVRRMTAAIGFLTLRLVRWAIGPCTLAGLASGAYRKVEEPELSIDLR